ncbi:MAG: GNAT family N-acetyltransferase [Chlorobiales bacterium]|nr:GNAT family N-acetyltransferase [Chlorobiales bacterium]
MNTNRYFYPNPMQYQIEKASRNDREAILKVMEPWNMHHVPSEEMDELDLSCFFVARVSGNIVGAAGYKLLTTEKGKTTLLGIRPEFSGMGLGRALQDARLEAMYALGIKRVVTNADRPETIIWYKKHYGYREIGSLKKICDFGLSDVDHWTTLEMDLEKYMSTKTDRVEK